jgi:hypothetical protein
MGSGGSRSFHDHRWTGAADHSINADISAYEDAEPNPSSGGYFIKLRGDQVSGRVWSNPLDNVNKIVSGRLMWHIIGDS